MKSICQKQTPEITQKVLFPVWETKIKTLEPKLKYSFKKSIKK